MFIKPSSCLGCPLYSAPGPVFAEGDPYGAKIIYIAQNPGQEEVKESRPLVGPSGRVFNRQLTEAGIRRSEVFITNVVKCLTPGNRIPTDEEIAKCRHFAEEEIKLARTDTVVLAGAVAFRAFIGDYSTLSPKYHPRTKKGQPVSIVERMGCVEQKDGKKWIGTLHPAHIMRLPLFRSDIIDHLRKAMAVSMVNVPLPEVEVVRDVQKICDYSKLARDRGEFSDDVETHQLPDVDEDDYVGGDYKVDMCGFSAQRYHSIIVYPGDISHWANTFADPQVVQYEHNGEYDRYHLEQVCPQLNRRFDTMLATHYLRNCSPKKLKPFTVSKYTNLPYYNRDLEHVSRELYCGMDVIATLLAGRQETLELREWGLYDLFMEFGMPLLPELEQQRRIGVNVDVRKVLLFKAIMDAKIAKAQELIAKVTGPWFNPDSPKQVGELLYEHWHLPKQYNRKDNKLVLTTDFEARKKLRRWIELGGESRKTEFQQALIFLTLQDYLAGEIQKLSFLNRVSPDGRIHAFYKAHGERPFRLSSTPNLQNFPVYDIADWGGARNATKADDPTGAERRELGSLRSIVVPDHEDDLLLTCDFSQMQLWIYAIQFDVKWLLSVYESGDYIYGTVYEKLYKEPFFREGGRSKEFKRSDVPEQRIRRAKAVPLGFLFNRQAKAVAEEYGWTLEEATNLRNWWFGLNPELQAAYSQIEYQVKQKGYYRHCFGQIMRFPGYDLNEAINSAAQSNEAFVMIGTIIKVAQELRRREYKNTRVMLTVHDAITLNVGGAASQPANLVEIYEEVVKPIMERPIPQLKGFRFKHEAKVSNQWDWKDQDYWKWKRDNALPKPEGQAASDGG